VILGFSALQRTGLRDGLLAFYKLSDTSDSSGRGNTLTNNNGVAFAAGKIGNAAEFNGSNWLNSSLQGTPKAVSLWVKSDEFSGFTNLAAFRSASDEVGFLIQGVEDDDFRFYTDESAIDCDIVIADGNWHHVVVSISSGIVKIYVDGSLEVSASGGTESIVTTKLGLGSYDDGTFDLLTGQIDAVGIWTRALSDGEIDALYNNGTGRELP
jgi:hypothetical protein